MKKKTSISLYILLILGLCFNANAQNRKIENARSDYESYNFVETKEVYLKVAERGYESEELFTKLGNIYYFNAQYDEAVKWYEKLFDFTPNPQEDILLLRYSQSLRATGKDKLAKQYYTAFIEKNTDYELPAVIDYLALISDNSGRYSLESVKGLVNNEQISYGSTVLNNKLVFASTTKDVKSFRNTKDAWGGLGFLSLYEVEIDENGQTKNDPKRIKELDSKFHESSPVFTKDGETMYFTRSNLSPKNKKEDQNLKIYKSVKVDGKWQDPVELNINSDAFSTAHPALNAEENKLYFASNRPGGFGETDLYYSEIASDGTIGEPVNLGPEINTPGKETFPFITDKNELYFSSDGHFGLGGLDVFYIEIKEDGYGNLLNVGEPINSYADDFAFGIDTETKRGFLSSNRANSKGSFVYDNIYTFVENEPIIDLYAAVIDGYVTDKHTEEPIAGATVTLFDPDNNIFAVVETDENGYYSVETNKFLVYSLRAEKEDYDTDEKISKANLEHQQIDFQLQREKEELIPGTNLAEVLNIPIIYFDFDKSNIRPDAQVELEKVLAVMEEYPDLRINIRSHTDSRGSDAYNMALSQRRAKSTLEYLVARGVDRSRLESEGLGETELVNRCSNGVPCSEAEHQKNRRSEFIVL